MKLLNTTKPAELPYDALLARLRGRRAVIDLAADKVEASSRAAIPWVYQRLNGRLRRRLRPFLDLLAMRNLVLALRYTLAGEAPAPSLLSDSLLDKPFLVLLNSGREPDEIVSQLEAMLCGDYPFACGLYQRYRSQGPGGIEQQLTEGILQQSLLGARDPCLVRLLRYLVDMRNLLTINKLWRWQVSQPPTLSPGGDLPPDSLQRVWARHDDERLTRLVSQRAGLSHPASSAIKMEQLMLKGLTRLLRSSGRDPLSLAVVIEYLWLAQLSHHNRILRQTLGTNREELLAEVLLI